MTHSLMIITHKMTATVKKNHHIKPCVAKFLKSEWTADQINEASLAVINYIMTPFSLDYTPCLKRNPFQIC